ncbi:hypothetical protein Tco_1156849 [Tanacetum coccineum]
MHKTTRNVELKKAMENYNPQEIEFDQKVSYHFTARSNILDAPPVKREIKTLLSVDTEKTCDNKYNMKQDYWIVKGRAPALDALRRQPPPNVEQCDDWEAHIKFWLDTKQAHQAAINA